MFKFFWYPITIIIAGAVVAFIFQNPTFVTVSFFNYQYESFLGLIVTGAFFAGFLFSIIIFLPDTMKRTWQLTRLKSENKKLKKYVDQDNIVYESKGLGSEGERFIKDLEK